MKISVIVPVYNVEAYLSKCITSILEQSFSEYEIIIINDGSEDNSGRIAEEFAEKYPEKVVYIKQKNKGLGGARNTGIYKAKGEYLLFVDSDDFIAPVTLENVYIKIEKEHADLLLFDFYRVSEDYESLDRDYGCFGAAKEFTLESYPEILFDNPSSWNKLYHRHLFLDTGIEFPEKVWYEDLCTTLKIYTKARKIVYLKDAFYYYYQRDSSIMHTKNCEKYLQIIDAMDELLKYFKEQGIYEEFEQELEFLAVYHLLFFSVVQINKIDPKSVIQKRIKEYVIEKFPNYQKNYYYKKRFGTKEKLILYFIRKGWFYLLRICFEMSKKMKCKYK